MASFDDIINAMRWVRESEQRGVRTPAAPPPDRDKWVKAYEKQHGYVPGKEGEPNENDEDIVTALANEIWSRNFVEDQGRPIGQADWEAHYQRYKGGQDDTWDGYLDMARQEIEERKNLLNEPNPSKDPIPMTGPMDPKDTRQTNELNGSFQSGFEQDMMFDSPNVSNQIDNQFDEQRGRGGNNSGSGYGSGSGNNPSDPKDNRQSGRVSDSSGNYYDEQYYRGNGASSSSRATPTQNLTNPPLQNNQNRNTPASADPKDTRQSGNTTMRPQAATPTQSLSNPVPSGPYGSGNSTRPNTSTPSSAVGDPKDTRQSQPHTAAQSTQSLTNPKIDVPYASIFQQAAEKYNVPLNVLIGMAEAESQFNPNAGSHAGAVGVMQLMPGTAAGLGVTNRNDPTQSINGGARYLRMMMDRYNGDINKAVQAYNAGPGNIDKGRIPEETKIYLPRVMNNAAKYGPSQSQASVANTQSGYGQSNTPKPVTPSVSSATNQYASTYGQSSPTTGAPRPAGSASTVAPSGATGSAPHLTSPSTTTSSGTQRGWDIAQDPLRGKHRNNRAEQWYFGERPNEYTGFGRTGGDIGWDMTANRGTPFVAAVPGTVERVGFEAGGWGNFVQIRGVDGKLYNYAHADNILVKEGERITDPNKAIGTVGLTGNTTGAHLDFTVFEHGYDASDRKYNGAIDPRTVVGSQFRTLNPATSGPDNIQSDGSFGANGVRTPQATPTPTPTPNGFNVPAVSRSLDATPVVDISRQSAPNIPAGVVAPQTSAVPEQEDVGLWGYIESLYETIKQPIEDAAKARMERDNPIASVVGAVRNAALGEPVDVGKLYWNILELSPINNLGMSNMELFDLMQATQGTGTAGAGVVSLWGETQGRKIRGDEPLTRAQAQQRLSPEGGVNASATFASDLELRKEYERRVAAGADPIQTAKEMAGWDQAFAELVFDPMNLIEAGPVLDVADNVLRGAGRFTDDVMRRAGRIGRVAEELPMQSNMHIPETFISSVHDRVNALGAVMDASELADSQILYVSEMLKPVEEALAKANPTAADAELVDMFRATEQFNFFDESIVDDFYKRLNAPSAVSETTDAATAANTVVSRRGSAVASDVLDELNDGLNVAPTNRADIDKLIDTLDARPEIKPQDEVEQIIADLEAEGYKPGQTAEQRQAERLRDIRNRSETLPPRNRRNSLDVSRVEDEYRAARGEDLTGSRAGVAKYKQNWMRKYLGIEPGDPITPQDELAWLQHLQAKADAMKAQGLTAATEGQAEDITAGESLLRALFPTFDDTVTQNANRVREIIDNVNSTPNMSPIEYQKMMDELERAQRAIKEATGGRYGLVISGDEIGDLKVSMYEYQAPPGFLRDGSSSRPFANGGAGNSTTASGNVDDIIDGFIEVGEEVSTKSASGRAGASGRVVDVFLDETGETPMYVVQLEDGTQIVTDSELKLIDYLPDENKVGFEVAVGENKGRVVGPIKDENGVVTGYTVELEDGSKVRTDRTFNLDTYAREDLKIGDTIQTPTGEQEITSAVTRDGTTYYRTKDDKWYSYDPKEPAPRQHTLDTQGDFKPVEASGAGGNVPPNGPATTAGDAPWWKERRDPLYDANREIDPAAVRLTEKPSTRTGATGGSARQRFPVSLHIPTPITNTAKTAAKVGPGVGAAALGLGLAAVVETDDGQELFEYGVSEEGEYVGGEVAELIQEQIPQNFQEGEYKQIGKDIFSTLTNVVLDRPQQYVEKAAGLGILMQAADGNDTFIAMGGDDEDFKYLIERIPDMSTAEKKALWYASEQSFAGWGAVRKSYDEIMALGDDASYEQIQEVKDANTNWVTEVLAGLFLDPSSIFSPGAALARIGGAAVGGVEGMRAASNLTALEQWIAAQRAMGESLRFIDDANSRGLFSSLGRVTDRFRLPTTLLARDMRNLQMQLGARLSGKTTDEVLASLETFLSDPNTSNLTGVGLEYINAFDHKDLLKNLRRAVTEATANGTTVYAEDISKLAVAGIQDLAREAIIKRLGGINNPAILQAFEKASGVQKMLLSPFLLKFSPRYHINNYVNNYATALFDGQLALRSPNAIINWWEKRIGHLPGFMRDASNILGTTARNTPAGKGAALGAASDMLGEHNMGSEAVASMRIFHNAFLEWSQNLWRNGFGGIEDAAKAGGVTDAEKLKDLRRAVADVWNRDDMTSAVTTWANANGVSGKALDDLVTTSVETMERTQAGAFAAANVARNHALLNYEDRTVLDGLYELVNPYQFWATRTRLEWAKRFADNPALLNTYTNMVDAFERGLNGDVEAAPWLEHLASLPTSANPYLGEEFARNVADKIAIRTGMVDAANVDEQLLFWDATRMAIPMEDLYGDFVPTAYEADYTEEENPVVRNVMTALDTLGASSPAVQGLATVADNLFFDGEEQFREYFEPTAPFALMPAVETAYETAREKMGGKRETVSNDAWWRRFLGYEGERPNWYYQQAHVNVIGQYAEGEIDLDTALKALETQEGEVWDNAWTESVDSYRSRGTVSVLTGQSVKTDAAYKERDAANRVYVLLEKLKEDLPNVKDADGNEIENPAVSILWAQLEEQHPEWAMWGDRRDSDRQARTAETHITRFATDYSKDYLEALGIDVPQGEERDTATDDDWLEAAAGYWEHYDDMGGADAEAERRKIMDETWAKVNELVPNYAARNEQFQQLPREERGPYLERNPKFAEAKQLFQEVYDLPIFQGSEAMDAQERVENPITPETLETLQRMDIPVEEYANKSEFEAKKIIGVYYEELHLEREKAAKRAGVDIDIVDELLDERKAIYADGGDPYEIMDQEDLDIIDLVEQYMPDNGEPLTSRTTANLINIGFTKDEIMGWTDKQGKDAVRDYYEERDREQAAAIRASGHPEAEVRRMIEWRADNVKKGAEPYAGMTEPQRQVLYDYYAQLPDDGSPITPETALNLERAGYDKDEILQYTDSQGRKKLSEHYEQLEIQNEAISQKVGISVDEYYRLNDQFQNNKDRFGDEGKWRTFTERDKENLIAWWNASDDYKDDGRINDSYVSEYDSAPMSESDKTYAVYELGFPSDVVEDLTKTQYYDILNSTKEAAARDNGLTIEQVKDLEARHKYQRNEMPRESRNLLYAVWDTQKQYIQGLFYTDEEIEQTNNRTLYEDVFGADAEPQQESRATPVPAPANRGDDTLTEYERIILGK